MYFAEDLEDTPLNGISHNHPEKHELWTPNEGINQRNLKICIDVAIPKKYSFEIFWIFSIF